MQTIMLATGIECSYPKVDGGTRRDQLEETRHYEYWREDFGLCKELGARVVRYGIPYYKMHTAPHEYDWSFTDEVLPVMREMGLIPILDLCHFGLPDWVGDFQNEDWAKLFADFAEVFARRYTWIRYYTPVNEILVCAKFSGKEGIWNEQLKTDKAMIMAHANMCRATLLAIEGILNVRPDAVFFQSEAAEQFYERFPETRERVEHLNELRFMTFDFLYGHSPSAKFLLYLMDNGATRKMFDWFMEHGARAAPHCVMGMDYYAANERLVHLEEHEEEVGPVLGWNTIARQYFERYRKPMMRLPKPIRWTRKKDLVGCGRLGKTWNRYGRKACQSSASLGTACKTKWIGTSSFGKSREKSIKTVFIRSNENQTRSRRRLRICVSDTVVFRLSRVFQ